MQILSFFSFSLKLLWVPSSHRRWWVPVDPQTSTVTSCSWWSCEQSSCTSACLELYGSNILLFTHSAPCRSVQAVSSFLQKFLSMMGDICSRSFSQPLFKNSRLDYLCGLLLQVRILVEYIPLFWFVCWIVDWSWIYNLLLKLWIGFATACVGSTFLYGRGDHVF